MICIVMHTKMINQYLSIPFTVWRGIFPNTSKILGNNFLFYCSIESFMSTLNNVHYKICSCVIFLSFTFCLWTIYHSFMISQLFKRTPWPASLDSSASEQHSEDNEFQNWQHSLRWLTCDIVFIILNLGFIKLKRLSFTCRDASSSALTIKSQDRGFNAQLGLFS